MRTIWKCLGCGECCKHLVGDRFGMPITPAECRRLGQYAKRHGISFEPTVLVPDVIGGKMYQFTQERCPFLDAHNRCRCYHLRPLICRMFPLHPFAVKKCSFLDKYLDKSVPIHIQMQFPEELKRLVYEYMDVIQPVLRESTMVYSPESGWIDRRRLPENQIKME